MSTSQRTAKRFPATPRSWERKEGPSLEPSEGGWPCLTPWSQTSALQMGRRQTAVAQLPSLWHFVTVAPGHVHTRSHHSIHWNLPPPSSTGRTCCGCPAPSSLLLFAVSLGSEIFPASLSLIHLLLCTSSVSFRISQRLGSGCQTTAVTNMFLMEQSRLNVGGHTWHFSPQSVNYPKMGQKPSQEGSICSEGSDAGPLFSVQSPALQQRRHSKPAH